MSDKQQFLEGLKSAPNPKELKEEFLEKFKKRREDIFETRDKIKKILNDRSPSAKPDEKKISNIHMENAESMAKHMEKATEEFINIAENITKLSSEGNSLSNIIRRFR